MKRIVLKYAAITLLIAGSLASCSNDSPNEVTGIILGSYSNSITSILVQVDKKHPIGQTIDYVASIGDCWDLSKNGTYRNIIQVQPLGLNVGDKIIFSYRDYRPNNAEDQELFLLRHGNALCMPPQTPIYVITDYQLLK